MTSQHDFKDLVMERFNKPHHYAMIHDSRYKSFLSKQHTCADNYQVFLLIKNNYIKDFKFHGLGCLISWASLDIMGDLLINKNLQESANIINHFFNLLDEKKYDANILENLIIFEKIIKFSNRLSCAKLSGEAVLQIINNY